MRINSIIPKPLFILPIIVALCLAAPLALATEKEEGKEDTRPERGITMAFEYPEVIINKGSDVTVDLIVNNIGKRDENVYFTIASAPPGWKTKIKTYSFSIMSVHLPEDETKNVQFFAEPEKATTPGDYAFKVEGRQKMVHSPCPTPSRLPCGQRRKRREASSSPQDPTRCSRGRATPSLSSPLM